MVVILGEPWWYYWLLIEDKISVWERDIENDGDNEGREDRGWIHSYGDIEVIVIAIDAVK